MSDKVAIHGVFDAQGKATVIDRTLNMLWRYPEYRYIEDGGRWYVIRYSARSRKQMHGPTTEKDARDVYERLAEHAKERFSAVCIRWRMETMVHPGHWYFHYQCVEAFPPQLLSGTTIVAQERYLPETQGIGVQICIRCDKCLAEEAGDPYARRKSNIEWARNR